MKLLFIYGINCTKEIWDKAIDYFPEEELTFVEFPHELTTKAKSVSDLTRYVYENYNDEYDAVIGHSMGGIIALELQSKYKKKFQKVIFIDTNLVPANSFYHNLMTKEHMDIYGDKLISMFNIERQYYTPDLLNSVKENFDYRNYLEEFTNVFGLYGDRGIMNYQNRFSDLNLESYESKLNIKFISNSCHMPMVENPDELFKNIERIIKYED